MQLKNRHYFMIVLMLLTAFLHFGAAFDRRIFPEGPDPLFTLNGLGYLGLLGAYFLPVAWFQRRRRLVWTSLFVYTIVTILAWVIIYVGFFVLRDGHPFFSVDALYGIPAKIAELLLLYFLWHDKP